MKSATARGNRGPLAEGGVRTLCRLEGTLPDRRGLAVPGPRR
jgi:hypothetical protein